MPPRPVLCLLLALATVPPFVAQASDSVVGSFTMFNRVARYHLELEVSEGGPPRAVSVRSLGPHMNRMQRVIVLPAEGEAVGADQIDVVAAGLPDLARLVCELHPRATRARAELRDHPVDLRRARERSAEVACGRSP
jgi:hypothetical protein